MKRTQKERETVAVVDATRSESEFVATIASLRRAHPSLLILAVTTGLDDGRVSDAGAVLWPGTLASAINETWRERRCHVLVVREPTTFPLGALDPGFMIVGGNMSIGTVSFLTRGTGFLALATAHEPAYADIDAVTATLRSTSPTPAPVPIPFPDGPAILLSAYALSAVGALADDVEPAETSVGAFSVRARRKGFIDVADPSTFLGGREGDTPPGSIAATYPDAQELDDVLTAPSSALSIVRRAARAAVAGVSVLIDGSCLGPLEMGTQVQTVALVRALARRADVARVAVALPGDLPPYARSIASDAKVDARPAPAGNLSAFGALDVAHQPFQPEGPVDIAACGAVAARCVVTLLDLIAYRGRSYQTSAAEWTKYRERLRRTVSLVDGVIAPTRDVERQIRIERLPVGDDRLFVAPIGTDHLAGDEKSVMPTGLAAAQFAHGPFLLVLGADYTHKNRDVAVRTLQELRRRGLELPLVMAGMSVYGSSQREEAVARTSADPVHVLGDVTSEERNWLLRHASVVLYPTSAEGIGLVPFEAAHFSTPTVLVPFGPLGELLGTLPVTAADWSPEALATTAETFLRDRDAAADQVRATLAIGAQYSWDASAASLVKVYRSVLARPAVEARRYVAQREGELHAIRAEWDLQQTANERLCRSRAYRLALRVQRLRAMVRA